MQNNKLLERKSKRCEHEKVSNDFAPQRGTLLDTVTVN